MDMDAYLMVKEQWDAITLITMPKSTHSCVHMHQSFLNMQCLKGSNIREFLTSLEKQHHELKAASITVTEPEYEHTILNGITEPLTSYVALMMSSLHLACKLTGEPFDMTDIIDTLCMEANCLKMARDLAQGQGKGKNQSTPQAPDEALAATGTFSGNDSRRCKGNCHHCGKPGHWACECHTWKREEAAATANQTRQTAQANPGTTSNPMNKPVGSANTVTIDKYDLDDRGFWAVEEELHVCHAEADPQMDDLDSNDEDEDLHAEQERNDQRLNWLDIEGEGWYTKDTARTHPNHTAPPMGNLEGDSDNDWEAFCTETWGAEDVVPHTLTIINTSEPHWAPDEEEYMPHTGDGLTRTTSSHREQVMDTMHHTHHPHDIVCSPELAQPDDPKLAIHAHEGQSPGSNAIVQAHQAPWLGPGTTTEEQDIPLASAALLEEEEKRTLIESSEQAAAPTTPSTSNLPLSPTMFFQSMPAAPGQVQNPPISPVQPHGSSCVHTASHIVHNLNPQPGGRVSHAGTHAPCLVLSLPCPGAFCYNPQTCRAPIFISLAPSFLITHLSPFPSDSHCLYLSIALILL